MVVDIRFSQTSHRYIAEHACTIHGHSLSFESSRGRVCAVPDVSYQGAIWNGMSPFAPTPKLPRPCAQHDGVSCATWLPNSGSRSFKRQCFVALLV
eukprot:8774159-Alexandrium_andersonii.AAC.1